MMLPRRKSGGLSSSRRRERRDHSAEVRDLAIYLWHMCSCLLPHDAWPLAWPLALRSVTGTVRCSIDTLKAGAVTCRTQSPWYLPVCGTAAEHAP